MTVTTTTAGTPRRVLVIDDSSTTAWALAEFLVAAGYIVDLAADGGQALVKMGEHRPDCLILDLILPTINGYEFLDSVSNIPGLAKVPVVVLSAYAKSQQPLTPNVVRVLEKPVEPAEVVRVVGEVLAEKEVE